MTTAGCERAFSDAKSLARGCRSGELSGAPCAHADELAAAAWVRLERFRGPATQVEQLLALDPTPAPPPPPAPPPSMPLEQAVAQCTVHRSPVLCEQTAEIDRPTCRSDCAARVDQVAAELVVRAVPGCLDHLRLPGHGGQKPACTGETLSSDERAWAVGTSWAAECSVACAKQWTVLRPQLLDAARRAAAARPPTPAPAETGGSDGLRCNDGTMSPSCSCSGSHRGCCSHHGGVAGCG